MKIIKYIVIAFTILLTGCEVEEAPLGPIKMERISSTEYLITRDELSMEFAIFPLIENEIMDVKENFSVYKDMETYIFADDLVDMKAYSFGFTDLIEVTFNNNEKLYYEVFLNKDHSDVIKLDYKINNIEEDMRQLGELIEKYPFVKEEGYRGDYKILENEGIKSEDLHERMLYKEYLWSLYFQTNILKHSSLNDRVAKLILLDGTIDNYGTIIHTNATSYGDFAYFDSKLKFAPFKINSCENMYDYYREKTNKIKNETEIRYYHADIRPYGDSCDNWMYSIDSFILDLSSKDVNSVSELDIDIRVGYKDNELKKVSSDKLVLIDDYLYIYPIFTELKNNINDNESYIVFNINIYKDDELILDLEDIVYRD